MKKRFTPTAEIARFRKKGDPMATSGGDRFGLFVFAVNENKVIECIATDGKGMSGEDLKGIEDAANWEHVSVKVRKRVPTKRGGKRDKWKIYTPTWREMCFVKDQFWDSNECVIQFHPPKDDYVNTHPNVLHLWRNKTYNHQTPPKECV